MPYLMLNFKAERDVQEIAGQFVPTGKESISFTMIDTDRGKVVELTAEAMNVKQVEREPKWGEIHAAGQVVLSKEPGQTIAKREHEEVKAERDSYRQKYLSGKTAIDQKAKIIEGLEKEAAKLKKKTHTTSETNLLATALDGYISELAANQQFESYEKAKKLYKRMTGIGWSTEDDDESDDDEEDDPGGSEPEFKPLHVEFKPIHHHDEVSVWDLIRGSGRINLVGVEFFQAKVRFLETGEKIREFGPVKFSFEDQQFLGGYRWGKTMFKRDIAQIFQQHSQEIAKTRESMEKIAETLKKSNQARKKKQNRSLRQRPAPQKMQWRSDERRRSKVRRPGR